MTYHFFDVELAKEYGVNCAILLANFDYWIAKNRANNVNYYDGRYWTYNSKKAFAELFPYLGEKQIRSALDKLINEGLIMTGNYNASAYDRTLWYAFTEKGESICLKRPMETDERANGLVENGQPIPNNKPNINTDSKPNILLGGFDFSETTEEELNEALKDFEEMRKKIKKPLTERAKRGIIKKLYDLSGGNASIAVDILDNSIMNSWQGIFELKQDPKAKQQAVVNSINEYPF